MDKPSRAGGRICCVASLSMSAQHALNWKIKCKALPHVQVRQTDGRKREREMRQSGRERVGKRGHTHFSWGRHDDTLILCFSHCQTMCYCAWPYVCVCVRVCVSLVCPRSSNSARPSLVATDAAIRIAIQMRRAHPFLRMNCKTPHIFHVIVCLPANWSDERGRGRKKGRRYTTVT